MNNQSTHFSRAGSIPLVGGELAFDFTNTASGRGSPKHREHLHCADDVIAWAKHARVLRAAGAKCVDASIAISPHIGTKLHRRALELREVIFAIGQSIAGGRRPSQHCVGQLVRIYGASIECGQLVRRGAGFDWSWNPAHAPIEAILGPIALSALRVLTESDCSRIKQCRGDSCGWLFVDTTKNKSRRWCEMKICGNRAKQKRHQHRRRIGRL
jgi:predicted RNA-binding Zn ribbon-like protein